MGRSLILNALRVRQNTVIPLYVFGIDGRIVPQLASVDFAHRTADGTLMGYQRVRVKRHIQEIHEYLTRDDAILPNAIVLAFDARATFAPLPGAMPSDWATFGTFTVPIPASAAERRPAFIVDGQQRIAALGMLDPKRVFPIVVVGFLAPTEDRQREQFLLVNKTRPLPRDLVNEILPGVTTGVPKSYRLRQTASAVAERLRYDEDSPFRGRIRGIGSSDEGANISVAAVMSVVEGSIKKRGVLFDFYGGAESSHHDIARMSRVMKVFFEGVRRTWPEAWAGSPKTSRLVHGVGVVALGHLMDRVIQEIDPTGSKAAAAVANRLEKIRRRCAWVSGRWPILGCAWNEIQNTSQDKARLTDYLLKQYGAA